MLTLTVLGLTKAVQASLMTEQPKLATWGCTPLIEHFEAVVVVETLAVVDDVVETLGVVEGAAGVVEGALGVVEGAAGVVDGRATVTDPRFCFFLWGVVQAAVTVTFVYPGVPVVLVSVEVTSFIGTKELQN
jgi:hypothetical protein